MSLVVLDEVTLFFADRMIFDAASLRLGHGDRVGLIGPNGSGKSTIFNMISGALRPSGGAIRFEDREIGGLTPDRICHLGIGRTFQIPRPFRRLTVRENVALAAYYGQAGKVSRGMAWQAAERAIETVRLPTEERAEVGGLGAAGLKKLELARAIGPMLNEVLASGGPAPSVEVTGRPKGREGVGHYLVTCYPVRFEDHVTGVATITVDITERKRAEEALRESEATLRIAINAADLGVWDLDLRTDAVTHSLRHDQIFGYSEPQAIWKGAIAARHFLDEDKPIIRHAFARARETGGLSFEARVRWPDGSIHWVAVVGRMMDDETGTPVRMSGVVADITERKRAEAARRTLAERAMRRVHRPVQIFAVAPDEPLALDTIEFWRTEEAGRAFRLMDEHTRYELEKFDFDAPPNWIRVALIGPQGEVRYLEDF